MSHTITVQNWPLKTLTRWADFTPLKLVLGVILQVFHNVLDLAVITFVFIYREVTGEMICRRVYILKLIEELEAFHKNSN